MSTGPALLVGLALLLLNGFFVAAEFALLASRQARLEQLAAAGDRRAGLARRSLRQLSLMLAGAQLGITMASLGLGAVAEPAIGHMIEGGLHLIGLPESLVHAVGFAIALSIVVFLHMVVGEMAPKSWAISDPERSALRLIRPFRGFVQLFRPFIVLLNVTANGVVRLFGIEPQDERAMAHSPSELVLLLEESARHGTLQAEHAELLTRTLELSGLHALSAATPRWDVVGVPVEASVDEVERVAAAAGLSRLVVYRGDLDHLVGVVHVKDVLLLDNDSRRTRRAEDLAVPALVTPESHALEDLLVEMRRSGRHFAAVIDDLGTVAGVVTLEDVLEELIGEFEDESDRPRRRIRKVAPGKWAASGATRPDELENETGLDVPEGPWDSLAGYVMDRLDRVAQPGDAVEEAGLRVEVTRMDGYAIAEVSITVVGDPH